MERTWAYRIVILFVVIFVAALIYIIVYNRSGSPTTPSIINRVQPQQVQ